MVAHPISNLLIKPVSSTFGNFHHLSTPHYLLPLPYWSKPLTWTPLYSSCHVLSSMWSILPIGANDLKTWQTVQTLKCSDSFLKPCSWFTRLCINWPILLSLQAYLLLVFLLLVCSSHNWSLRCSLNAPCIYLLQCLQNISVPRFPHGLFLISFRKAPVLPHHIHKQATVSPLPTPPWYSLPSTFSFHSTITS